MAQSRTVAKSTTGAWKRTSDPVFKPSRKPKARYTAEDSDTDAAEQIYKPVTPSASIIKSEGSDDSNSLREDLTHDYEDALAGVSGLNLVATDTECDEYGLSIADQLRSSDVFHINLQQESEEPLHCQVIRAVNILLDQANVVKGAKPEVLLG